MLAKVAIFSN